MTDQNEDLAPTLFIIDGLAQLFRAYHAIRQNLTSPVTHEPTNAVYGFAGMLLKIFEQYQPDYLVVAIDVSGARGTFRSEIYPEYKANRDDPPSDFKPQVERALELTRLMNIPVIGVDRYEADDVIATLVERCRSEQPSLNIRIISKDKDLEQLIDDHVEMFDVHTDQSVTLESLQETKGITPSQVVDVLTLMGDTSDNIPGVKGIGKKTAAQLIAQYGSLDQLLEHLDEIKGKRRENIEASLSWLETSRDLVTLRRDVEFDFDLDQARLDLESLPFKAMRDAFHELGFSRFLPRIDQLHSPVSSTNESADTAGIADTLFGAALTTDSTAEMRMGLSDQGSADYQCIRTKESLEAYIEQLKDAPIISVDTETTSVSPTRAVLCGISLSVEPGTGVYVPVRAPNGETHLDQETVITALRPILEDPDRPLVGHNIKYDLIVLRRHGIKMRGVVADTMVADYLVETGRSSRSLDSLAAALLDYRCIPISDLIGQRQRGKSQKTFDQIPLEPATVYAAEDADITLRLHHKINPKIKLFGMRRLYDDVEMPLVSILADMEYTGIRVDPDILDQQRERLTTITKRLRQEIIDAAPHSFNPDSPKQLAAVLFNDSTADPPGLGLRVVKRRKTGPSTDLEVLEKLTTDPNVSTPIPTLMIEYRQLTKLVNTYLVSLKDEINPTTGRVHTSFNQTSTSTGRLSSNGPNLQNIPIRTEVGRQIRKAFIASEGCRLITADYSQIELRILAHLSEDEALIDAFRNNEDIHRSVAARIYNLSPDEVTGDQRRSAKMVNFGIVYGITPFGLARRLGENTTNEQAAEIITDYKKRYPGINRFLERCVEKAQTHGFVETMLKRRRTISSINSPNAQEQMLGRRVAINSVVQGSAADLIKLAMINLHRLLPEQQPDTRMLLQIHDELVFDVPVENVDEAKGLIVETMESAMTLKIPIVVDAAVSANWMECK